MGEEISSGYSWFSMEWFTPSTLNSFTWERPEYLYGIVAIPILFLIRWLWRFRFNQKLPVALTQKDLKSSALNLIRLLSKFLLSQILFLQLQLHHQQHEDLILLQHQ